jgi:hypothetical protein
VPDGGFEEIDASESDVMTGVAADEPTRREARVEEEHFA